MMFSWVANSTPLANVCCVVAIELRLGTAARRRCVRRRADAMSLRCAGAWGNSFYSLFVLRSKHKSAWRFAQHKSKKVSDCERGHGDVVAPFVAIRFWSVMCSRKRHFPCQTQTTRWGPDSGLVPSYAEAVKDLCTEDQEQARPTGNRSATTVP